MGVLCQSVVRALRMGRAALAAVGTYLWRGWGAVSSVCVCLAAWQWGAEYLGALILPSPLEAFRALFQLWQNNEALPTLITSAQRALLGFVLSVFVGSVLGLAAGVSQTISMMSRPIITILVGMPPIAWLVLALLWFGMSDGTPIFTVFIASFPFVFVGALQGARTLDGQLRDMALMFRLPLWQMVVDVYVPHIVSYLFPAWISALGMSWKIVVMAELLSTDNGVGAALAVSRSHLDTAVSMAWMVALVTALLAVEYLVLEPIKRHVEAWRT